jgi:mono/diheme cytochrome c family protein
VNGKVGTPGGTSPTNALTREAITTIVVGGRNQMPACGSALSAQDREDLASHVL